MVARLNHIGIAVPNLTTALSTYRAILQGSVSGPDALPADGVTIARIDLPNIRIDLFEPLGDRSPVKRFIMRNPTGGIHHLCFEVYDISDIADRLKARNMRILGGGEPKLGANNTLILFVDPADFHGSLVEFEQARQSRRS